MRNHSKKSIYVGPSRPFNLPLEQNAILAGEPERIFPQIEPFFEKHRDFQKLFVPVAELASARASLRQPGSRLAIISAEIGAASSAFKNQKA